MDDLLPLILFLIGIISIAFYVLFKCKTVKEFSFSNTFPFETDVRTHSIKVSLITLLIFTICSIFFYLTIYTKNFENSYVLLASISAFAICGLFFVLNLINLVNLKVHFFAFSLFAALITTQSVVMGFHSINAYQTNKDQWLFIVLAVVFFAKAVMELLMVSPLFKFSFLMEVEPKSNTLKKPNFIRLAFYEWLYLLLFIINSFLLLVEKSI